MHEDAQAAADHFKSDKQTPSDTVKHKILIHKNKNNVFLSEQTIIKYRYYTEVALVLLTACPHPPVLLSNPPGAGVVH